MSHDYSGEVGSAGGRVIHKVSVSQLNDLPIDEHSMISRRQGNAKLEYNGVFRVRLCMITDSRSLK